MLSVSSLVSGYGRVPAIRDVTLEVKSGEFVALAGANNAGKSTLLKTIAGILRPLSGSIRLHDEELVGKNTHEIVGLGITLVSEGRPIFPQMRVIDNLLIGSYTARARAERDSTLQHIFQLFPVLKARVNQVSSTLSGGEQQMLVLGRALMSRPRFLLIDEPSLGLAPAVVERIYGALSELAQQGMGLLVADQNLAILAGLSSRMYVLAHGTVFVSGDGKDLLKDKRTRDACMGIARDRELPR